MNIYRIVCLSILTFHSIFVDKSAYGLIKVSPVDTESLLGKTVSLNCSIEGANGKNIDWFHKPVGAAGINTIYFDGRIFSRYSERFNLTGNYDNGEFNLQIVNVRSEDAGQFQCIYRGETKSAELIVLAVYPSAQSCSVTTPPGGAIASNVCEIEPDIITLTCNISYYGNKIPILQWNDTRGYTYLTSASDQLSFNTLSIKVRATDNDTNVTCGTSYLSPTVRSNVTWTTTVKGQILLNKTNERNSPCNTEKIFCNVSSIPHECVAKWTTANGSSISIDTLHTDALLTGTYTCTAECKIRQKTCFIKELTVYHNCKAGDTSTVNVGLAVGISVGIVLLLVIIGITAGYFIYKKPWKNKTTNNPQPEMVLLGAETAKL